MIKSLLILFLIITTLSCQNIFTTNHLEALKEDPSNMSSEALLAAAEDGDKDALEELLKNRITPEEVAADPSLKDQFIKETTLLADYMIEEADFQGLVEDALASEEGGTPVEDFLNDPNRVEDLETASDLVVEAYLVDPDSLTDTQKLVGSVGLLSDILSDETKSDTLSSLDVRDETTLAVNGFTQDEIDNILLADEMLEGSTALDDITGGIGF